MKRVTILLFLLSAIMLNLLSACDGLDEHYSTNPNHRLSFSIDTLSFDTVFSTIGSTTKELMIYNNNSEALNIESILLAGGGTTGFRINVDGRKGDSFNNVSILAEDSMYVFVEVTVNPNDADQPLLIEDSIVFVTNGIQQSVLLEAYGQDVYLHKGGLTVTKDTVLSAKRPYLIYDNLVVEEGAKMTIEKGAIFYMHDNANIVVHGSMNANGTQDEPIIFRGDRLDFILDNVLPYDRTPGQWGGIYLKNTSFDNTMDYVIVRNGTTGITCELSEPEHSKLVINNSQITNMSKQLFFAINCNVTAANSEFSNARNSVVTLVGGKYYFAHCTLANYMTLLSRDPSSQTLRLANNATVDKNGPYPITQAHFDNCIIDGSWSAGEKDYEGEIQITSGGEWKVENTDFDYLFNHCMIKTKGVANTNFKDVIFLSKSPSYLMMGEKENKYSFDFRLASEEEEGIGKADLSIAQKYPKDRYGINRLTSTGPTIGAYEYDPSQKE
ncbi:hypothetical protein [Parabacteroides bouchesdurhonensis]|uniref:hypothetical protein n=1 Tax=Parabacteroides bouchesdurhonensis TaxID=1936995 RepID=UPI000C83EDED|nr:hypothetical protein [Parabacteroides bouchesdurhonensis]